MVKRSFAGRAPTLDQLLAAQKAKKEKEAAALQSVTNTINAVQQSVAQQAAAQKAAEQKAAAQQAAAQQAAAQQAAAQQATTVATTQKATTTQQAATTAATQQAATTAATTAATQQAATQQAATQQAAASNAVAAAVSNAVASSVQNAAATTTAAAATASAAKAAQAAKVSSLPINTGRFARSASNVPKTGDQVVVNGRTYTYVTEDRSVKGTTIGESKAQEAAAAAAKAAASTPTLQTEVANITPVGPGGTYSKPTLQTDVANTTIVGPGGENPLSSSSTLKTTSTNNNLVGGTTSADKSSSLLGTSTDKSGTSTDKSSSLLGTTSSGAKTTTSSDTKTTTSSGAKTTTSSGAKTTAASLPFSTGRFSRNASNSVLNTTDEYITVNGKKYLNNNYKGTSSSSYYDVDAALTDMYNQAVAAGATGITKPTSYGSTITSQTQAQEIIDSYQTKLNAALPVTYDISANLANVNDTLKEYNISVKAPDVTQYTSEASAQAAIDAYVAEANKALDTWAKSQPVQVYDDLGREQSVTYSQYEQMSTWQSKAKSSGTYTVLPEEVANSNAKWWINSKGLYEWEPVTAGDKAQLALENKQRAQLHQAAKTTLTAGASPSAAYSKEWYSTGGNRSTAKIGSGDVKIAQIKASSSVNNAATAVSNTAQTNKATLVTSSKSTLGASSSSSSSKSSEAEAYAAATQKKAQAALASIAGASKTIQEQLEANKSVTQNTAKLTVVSAVSAEQKAAELTGSSTKSDFVTGNSALAKYNRAVNAQNTTEPNTPTTYIQGDKNKLLTYAAEKNNVEDLDEQWAKIEAAGYDKNVITTAQKQSTLNPNYKSAIETAKAEAAKQEQLRQQIIANPLLDASGAVINQITTSAGAAKTSLVNTAKIITPVYASQESKAAALTATKKDYDTLLGMGLTSSKDPNTGKTLLAAQAVDPTTQYYTQNAKQTAAIATEAQKTIDANKAAMTLGFKSSVLDYDAETGSLSIIAQQKSYDDVQPFRTVDQLAQDAAVEKALAEAKKINPNGSDEYFEGVANVARRSQMSVGDVMKEDLTNANKQVASKITQRILPSLGEIQTKRDEILSGISIPTTGKTALDYQRKGQSIIQGNVVTAGLQKFVEGEYNAIRNTPVSYAGELGLMYAGGALFGAGTKLATTGARSGLIRAGDLLASVVPTVGKARYIGSTAAKATLGVSSVLVQGSRYVEPVTNTAFMADIGLNLLSSARKGEYETVFEMGKSLAVGGLGYKNGMETTTRQPLMKTAETNLLDVPSVKMADILPGVRTAKIVRVSGNTESARSDVSYGKTLTLGSKPLLTVVTTKGTRGISLGAAAAPESLLTGKAQAFSKLETQFFKKTVAERGGQVEAQYLDSALNIAKNVSKTRQPLYRPENFEITSRAIPENAKAALTEGITSYTGEIQVTGSVPMKAQANGFVTRTTHDLEIYGDDAAAIATHLSKSLESQGLVAGKDFRIYKNTIEFPSKSSGWDTGVEIFSHTDVAVASSGSPAPTARPGESEIAFGYESRKPVLVDAGNGKYIKTQALAEQVTRKVAGSTFLENKELVPQHVGRYKDIQDTITTATAFAVKGKVPIEKDVVSFVNSAYKKYDNVPRLNEKTGKTEIPFNTVKSDPVVDFIHTHQRLPTEAELSPESFAWKRNAAGKYDLVNKQTGEVVRKNISKDEMLASKKVEKNLKRTVNDISDRSLLYERKARDEISSTSRSPSPSSRLTTRGSPSPGALASSPRSMVSPSPSTRLSSPSPVSRMISQSPKTVSPSQTSRMVSSSPRSTSPSPSPRSQSFSPKSQSFSPKPTPSMPNTRPAQVIVPHNPLPPSPISPRRESPSPSIISPTPRPTPPHWDSPIPPRRIPSIPPGGVSPIPPSPSVIPSVSPSPSPSPHTPIPGGDDSSISWFPRTGGWRQPPYPKRDKSTPDKPNTSKKIRVPKRQRENVLSVKTEVSTFKQMFGDKKRRGKPRL